MSYKILMTEKASELQAKVCDHIDTGWTPLGGAEWNVKWHQTMVKGGSDDTSFRRSVIELMKKDAAENNITAEEFLNKGEPNMMAVYQRMSDCMLAMIAKVRAL